MDKQEMENVLNFFRYRHPTAKPTTKNVVRWLMYAEEEDYAAIAAFYCYENAQLRVCCCSSRETTAYEKFETGVRKAYKELIDAGMLEEKVNYEDVLSLVHRLRKNHYKTVQELIKN